MYSEESLAGYPQVPLHKGVNVFVDVNGIVGANRRIRLGFMPCEKQVKEAVGFFEKYCPPKTKTGRISSYSLKHLAESISGYYISNGSLIVAAHSCGIVLENLDGINALVGVGKRWYRDMEQLKKNMLHQSGILPVKMGKYQDEQ